jgi:hypothetical protein
MINWHQGNQVGFDLTFDITSESGAVHPKTMEVVGTVSKINPKEGTITVRYSHPTTFQEGVTDLHADISAFREGTLF